MQLPEYVVRHWIQDLTSEADTQFFGYFLGDGYRASVFHQTSSSTKKHEGSREEIEKYKITVDSV